uniref:Uncharacterized protein n=1 Tax=Triticum urartu TaxID=4572 RepID=A0A8R7V684_TRIUA
MWWRKNMLCGGRIRCHGRSAAHGRRSWLPVALEQVWGRGGQMKDERGARGRGRSGSSARATPERRACGDGDGGWSRIGVGCGRERWVGARQGKKVGLVGSGWVPGVGIYSSVGFWHARASSGYSDGVLAE